jgi:flagellar biosynthesis protein FliP
VANLERDLIYETLISGYKSHQISAEESKEKIFKKFRELLTKNQIKFEETLFEEILKLEYKNNSMIVDDDIKIIEEKK